MTRLNGYFTTKFDYFAPLKSNGL